MIKEAVILAGGFGTRLSHVLGDVPKPMAPVYGKPFLCYVMDRLAEAGIEKLILATGYKHECIETYFGDRYRNLELVYSRETEPLFTGGAILQAARKTEGESFLVVNGDTLFDIDIPAFVRFHQEHTRPVSIALRRVEDTSRYGAVETNGTLILSFREKENSSGAGVINGGIYAIRKEWLMVQNYPKKFSFEKEVLQPLAPDGVMGGLAFESYFIDIGIPDDYYRAQQEFKALFPHDRFLFLDRDGVLNKHLWGDYVRRWEMWEWMPGVLAKTAELAKRYARIFIVSNQQGIGKGLFSEQDLKEVHDHMMQDIEKAGGRIDRIYVCTALAETDSPDRKPAVGMALQAQKDFPEVNFHAAVMVGDSLSDMLFGYRCGMRCVYLSNGDTVPTQVRDYTDIILPDLPCM